MRLFVLCLVGLAFSSSAQILELGAFDWAPDGQSFLLVVDRTLYLAHDPAFSSLRPLYPGMRVDWARFGSPRFFVFVSPVEGGFALWRGFPEGGAPELLYQSAHPILWPTASVDGERIAFVEDWDKLVLLELKERRVRTVLEGLWPKATPEFLPAGQALLFAGFWPKGPEPSWELFYLDLHSLDLIQLTSDAFFDWCPRVSPDGLWVAFVSNRGGTPDIWILPLLGGWPFPVTQDPWEDAFPAWSPDGTQVGYVSLRPEGWRFVLTGTH